MICGHDRGRLDFPELSGSMSHAAVMSEVVDESPSTRSAAPVGVNQASGHRAAAGHRAAQCRDRQGRLAAAADGAPDDAVGVEVLDRAQEQLALLGAVFGQTGQPQPVGRVGGEVPLHQIIVPRWPRTGLWTRARVDRDPTGVVHSSDEGVQYVAVCCTQPLAGAVASVGSTGDSYDNALAEAFTSLLEAELIRNKGSWRSIDDVETAVAEYADWFNHRRLHGEIGFVPPTECEDTSFRHRTAPATAGAALQSLC